MEHIAAAAATHAVTALRLQNCGLDDDAMAPLYQARSRACGGGAVRRGRAPLPLKEPMRPMLPSETAASSRDARRACACAREIAECAAESVCLLVSGNTRGVLSARRGVSARGVRERAWCA